jgi:hypothetical protein
VGDEVEEGVGYPGNGDDDYVQTSLSHATECVEEKPLAISR